ncbi:hypothetical protein L345_04997, partial [Ophiophagus hannah]
MADQFLTANSMAGQGDSSAAPRKTRSGKGRSASQDAADKIRTKAVYSRKPTRAEEKDADRRMRALEKQISRIQKKTQQEKRQEQGLSEELKFLISQAISQGVANTLHLGSRAASVTSELPAQMSHHYMYPREAEQVHRVTSPTHSLRSRPSVIEEPDQVEQGFFDDDLDLVPDRPPPFTGLFRPALFKSLLHKAGATAQIRTSLPTVSVSSDWASGEDDHVVGRAEYDFNAISEEEISFRAGEMLKLAPKERQPKIRGWLLASRDGQTTGLIPANYVRVLGKRKGKKTLEIEKITEHQSSVSNTSLGQESTTASALEEQEAAFESVFVETNKTPVGSNSPPLSGSKEDF